MSQMLDRKTLDRLIALGKQRGELRADDLEAMLPIHSMDVDALVLVMLELDAAGVSVEPEAFGPPADQASPAARHLPAASSAPVRAPVASATETPRKEQEAAPSVSDGERLPTNPEDDEGASVDRAFILAGLMTLGLLGAVLLLL